MVVVFNNLVDYLNNDTTAYNTKPMTATSMSPLSTVIPRTLSACTVRFSLSFSGTTLFLM